MLEAEAGRGQEEGAPRDSVLKPSQLEAVRRLPLQRRISRVAGVLRTQQFMHRYHTNLSTRDARMQELENRWYVRFCSGSKVEVESRFCCLAS